MENFEKILIGLVLFAVTSIIAFLFRMRQLYVAVPKLFRHAPISNEGSLCELHVYNKGNQVEEDIQVNLDPELKGELLASSSGGISLDGAILKVERLHKGTEVSVVLLIEKGLLDTTKIVSVSSKGTEGRVFKKITEIPPNFARAFLFFLAYVAFFPALFYGDKAYYYVQSAYVEARLENSYKNGWKDLRLYYDSDLRQSYSNQEFPIQFLRSVPVKDKGSTLEFEVYNKAALPIEVSVNRKGASTGDISNFTNVEVPPMSKALLFVKKPDSVGDIDSKSLSFNIKFGGEFIHGLIYVANTQ